MTDDFIPATGERTTSFKAVPFKPKDPGYRGEVLGHFEGTIRPIGCKVLIELDAADVFHEGTNILIPQEYRDVSEHGTVVGVGGGVYVGGNENGTGARHYPLTLKVGDRVRLRRWNMAEVMINGKLHVIMPESDILWSETP